MNLRRAFAVSATLAVVGCSFVVPFDDYDREYAASLTDAGPTDNRDGPASLTDTTPITPTGEASPPADAPPACAAQTASDDKNCGACGHDCRGAKCTLSLCEADTFTKNDYITLKGLTQDDDWLYASGQFNFPFVAPYNAVGRGRKQNKADLAALPPAMSAVQWIVSRGDSIYWTEDKGIGRVQKPADNDAGADAGSGDAGSGDAGDGGGTDAGKAPSTLLVAEIEAPDGIAVDDVNVYWTMGKQGVIKRAPRATGVASVVVSPAPTATGIATDGTFLFWTESTGARVMRARVDGTEVKELVANQPSASGIWLDDDGVYWTTRRALGTVMRAAKDGTGLVMISGNEATPPTRVVTDSAYVYWIDEANFFANGAVRRAPKSGGEALTLAALQAPLDLVVDTTWVYWTSTDKAIRRVGK